MQKLAGSKHETERITLSLDEYESMKATIETSSSSEAMEKIRKGEEDLRAGKCKRLEDLNPIKAVYHLIILSLLQKMQVLK